MSSRWDVVVLGGAGTDFLARGAQLPGAGDSVRGDAFRVAPGGKGLNAAVAAARLDARVALIARVGADARGADLVDRLREEGVDTRHVRRDRRTETAATVVQVAGDGRKQTLGVPGANENLSPRDVDAAGPILSRAGVLIAQLEVPLETVQRAVERAHAAGVRVLLDPAPPRALPQSLLKVVEILVPNASEAEALAGIRPEQRESAERATAPLLERGVRLAAVSAQEGVLLATRQGEKHWFPNLPVDVVDTTGAGDAFAAALAVALTEGRDIEGAGTFAHAAAALTTTRLGAAPALPTRTAVLRLLLDMERR